MTVFESQKEIHMQKAMEVEEIAEAIELLEIFDASLPSTTSHLKIIEVKL